jgi:hypothetical protein
MTRRNFLKGVAGAAAAAAASSQGSSAGSPPKREPVPTSQAFDSPVLESLSPVIERSRDVQTDRAKIAEHSRWLACEELPLPEFALPFGIGKEDPEEAIDYLLVANTLNFAFTDFDTRVKFQVDFADQHWSDSQAMFACIKRAVDDGVPFLDGAYLSAVTRADLERVFRGNIEMPMLDERVEILRAVGKPLQANYDGRFHNFVDAAAPRLYADGQGLIDKLVREFPRFNDVSPYDGHEIKLYKLAQLGIWTVYSALHGTEAFKLEDPEKMTAFADYIVPVALEAMGILRYSSALKEKIEKGELIPADSPQEVEIRAHTLYATALLTEEINKRRPADRQIIIPQVDARLWTHFHTTHCPHHLTRTIMY